MVQKTILLVVFGGSLSWAQKEKVFEKTLQKLKEKEVADKLPKASKKAVEKIGNEPCTISAYVFEGPDNFMGGTKKILEEVFEGHTIVVHEDSAGSYLNKRVLAAQKEQMDIFEREDGSSVRLVVSFVDYILAYVASLKLSPDEFRSLLPLMAGDAILCFGKQVDKIQ